MRDSSAAPPPELPASIGRYEVLRLLGEGSMGRVLLARDPVLERHVALKHLRGDLGLPAEVRDALLRRMKHEARAAARVTHPNLVVLHDMGDDVEVGLYLVFEFIDGPTLKQRTADGGRLRPEQAARLARELGGALAVAHEAGVLHRDVKPENVMLARTGGKIADFGIARVPDSTLTHRGGLIGTPAYSAPETFRGGKHSPASDQFSLAATLYEAVSGTRAFPGDDAVTVAGRIADGPPPPFAPSLGLPPAVDEVLRRAMARTPEQRFPDCADFGEALAAALLLPAASEVAGSAFTQPGVATTSAPQERRLGQVILGAIVVIGTAGLVLRAALRDDAPAPVTPAPSAGVQAPHRPQDGRDRQNPRAGLAGVTPTRPARLRPEPPAPLPAPADAGTNTPPPPAP